MPSCCEVYCSINKRFDSLLTIDGKKLALSVTEFMSFDTCLSSNENNLAEMDIWKRRF